MRARSTALGLTILAALVAGVAPALAQQAGQPGDLLTARLADLDAQDPARRIDALRELAADPSISLPAVEAALKQHATLTTEQREALLTLGRRRFENSTRGAMGVQFARFDGAAGGVEIAGTVGGFDSQQKLRPGDIIRAIDGVRITLQEAARAAIVSHDPGDEVPIELVRRGEVVTTSLRLGSFVDLQRGAPMDPPTLDRAWQLRCARTTGVPAAREVEPGMPLERWVELEEQQRRRAEDQLRAQTQAPTPNDEDETPMVSVGGAARSAASVADTDFSLQNAGAARGIEADRLRAQITAYHNQVIQLERRARMRGMPQGNRKMLEMQIQNYKRNIQMLREQLADMAAQPANR